MNAGESVLFHYLSDIPVDFDIHYHTGFEIKYPVKIPEKLKLTRIFKAAKQREYCLLWTNNKDSKLTLTFGYKTKYQPKSSN